MNGKEKVTSLKTIDGYFNSGDTSSEPSFKSDLKPLSIPYLQNLFNFIFSTGVLVFLEVRQTLRTFYYISPYVRVV